MSFSFMDTFTIVVGLIIIALIGYLLIKLNVLKEDFISPLAKFVLYCAQPLLMVICFQRSTFEADSGMQILIVVGLSLLLYVFAFGASKLLFFFKKRPQVSRVYVMSSMLGNVGFMGIPIIEALFPNDPTALLAVAMAVAVFYLFLFTGGVYIITGDKKYVSFKKALLSPTMIGIYVGLIFFFFNVKIPTFLFSPIDLVGNLCIPLSFIILGMRFATIKPITLFTDLSVYLSSAMKLVVIPLVMFLFCYLLNVSHVVTAVITITAAMPSASTVLMFSEVYRQDSVVAGKCILFSTIVSTVTIPLILMLL